MKRITTKHSLKSKRLLQLILSGAAVLSAAFLPQHRALADVSLVLVDGGTPATPISPPFRWQLEEDNTDLTVPGLHVNNSASLVIHKSHAPVVANGEITTAAPFTIPTDPTKRYVLSILKDNYSVGGNTIGVGQTTVGVVLNKHPLPTAQISILVFKDHNPINNVPDATEEGLPGFRVTLADFLGGPIMTDVFGNPLGTQYATYTQADADGGTIPPGFSVGDYIPDGEGGYQVAAMGTGFIYTDANGKALVKNLAMGKYGVQVVPPTGADWVGGHATANVSGQWHQTATIEGTPTVDAWVGANEPMVFVEGFGAGTYHTFFGFVDPGQLPSGGTTIPAPSRIGTQPTQMGNMTVRGVNRFDHFGRPSVNGQPISPGPAVSDAWIGLNQTVGGVAGIGLYAAPCDPATGEFVIYNVPPGTYQLVTWDTPLDALFGVNTITVPAPDTGAGEYNLGDVFSKRWFGTLEGSFFYDMDEDGFRDPDENGIAQMALNIRWRDGTIYQSTVTDATGDYALSEVFPFFKWLVLDSDFSRFKPTGMTAVVDEGGAIPADAGWTMPSEGVRNPQPQMVLNADGTQSSMPITNPNTGNNFSRTETGQVLLEAMHLFLNQNNRIDWGRKDYPPGQNGGISGVICYQTTRAEEDPRDGTNDPWEPGIPRVQVALYQYDNSVPLPADTLDSVADPLSTRALIQEVNGVAGIQLADVDNYPLGWADGTAPRGPEDVDQDDPDHTLVTDEAAVFDPGDAIQVVWTDSWDDNMPTGVQQTNPPVILGTPIIGSDNYATWNQIRPGVFDGGYAFNDIPAGKYIVQASPPPGYKIQTEESLNVVFGDAYVPSKLALTPPIVGDYHQVPAYLTLFPDQATPAPFAGKWRPLADRKFVQLSDRQNAACDFQMYTEVPKATRVHGFVLNDLTAEFNAQSPIFGEKGSPGWIPISIRDWANHEVAHIYADEYGTYNALVPSTYNAAVPMPSGVAPNMLTIILNDPTMPDPSDPTGNTRIPDPHYNPNFATTPWTLHYYPGTLLYADTPIVPTAALVGFPNSQLDVEPATETPVIKRVSTSSGVGPYLETSAGTITIESMGNTSVPNPAYTLGVITDPPISPLIVRDYGFGESQGMVTINGQELTINSWENGVITAALPGGFSGEGQLIVTRANGARSPIGVTFTVGGSGTVRRVALTGADFSTIQAAVDAAANGDLILVDTNEWAENVILYKPVRLQGSGAGTIINANPVPFTRLASWHQSIDQLLGGDPFTANENPGIMVLGQYVQAGILADAGFASGASRIDGFQIKGSIAGGGISVFNNADGLRISNNRIIGNQGSFVGGIAIGMNATLGTLYDNPNITIEYNQILKNGGVNGPGGIGIFTGATGYRVQHNLILGNFSRGSGGGIGHEGVSPNGLIANNSISWNEVFYGALGAAPAPAPGVAAIPAGEGGGIFISGELAPGALSSGAGSVTILNNLIQGNLAGAGDGGGIRVVGLNGADVEASASQADWYALDIINNIIVNNVSALAGGGISLRDAARVRILNNTIANNDSSATAQSAFTTLTPNQSTPQVAGIASHEHNTDLRTASGQTFSDPLLQNNIVSQNRSWFYDRLPTTPPAGLFERPAGLYWDLGVVELAAESLTPDHCLLSGGGDPQFVGAYLNTLFTAVVLDEAGNNINVRHSPTGPVGDYHIGTGSAAIDAGTEITDPPVAFDFDHQVRPDASVTDIGADEYGSSPAVVIFAPTAPNAGPTASGAAPAITAPPGAGTPPGPMLAPVFEPMPEDTDGIDTDGDSIVDNDNHYVHLTAGDGFVTMADGNELYCFGFSDVTEMVNMKVMEAMALTGEARTNKLREIKPMVLMEGMLRANFAAPTLVFKEGQHVYMDLSNVGMFMRPDLFDPHTVHFHGFPNAASIFDGEPMASISINMGGTLRYFYQIEQPGTYLYHCHVEATEHMEMGMIGNLWVLPKQNNLPVGTPLANLPPGKGATHQTGYKYVYNDGDGSTYYDVDLPLQMLAFDRNFHEQHILVQPLPFWSLDESYPMFNGRGYPDTVNPGPLANSYGDESQKVSSTLTATVGQRIALRISNVSVSDFHTLTVLGIPMRVVGKDARLLRGPTGQDLTYETTSITLGGGESADAILDTTGLAPGKYFVYDSRLNHLNNDQEDYGGMMTEIVLTAP